MIYYGYEEIKNFLLTESTVITEKNHTGVLIYVKDSGLILSSNDQADEVNERFKIRLVLNKQNIPSQGKICHIPIARQRVSR